MTDIALRTRLRPLTVLVHEVDDAPHREAFGLWRIDQLFSMLDELTRATLKRVTGVGDAQFIVELGATSDPSVMTVLLRESIVVMTSVQISATADLDQWEAIAKRFATMIDAAAECYAAPLTTV